MIFPLIVRIDGSVAESAAICWTHECLRNKNTVGDRLRDRSVSDQRGKRHIRDIIMPGRSCVPIYNRMISR